MKRKGSSAAAAWFYGTSFHQAPAAPTFVVTCPCGWSQVSRWWDDAAAWANAHTKEALAACPAGEREHPIPTIKEAR